ncbi:uncharacterized protein LOC143424856 [Xylocopa sonorina]|uniref:uncharacterized protein LOC143424856 n=1 Tax=Xylocopa sonorina TaxID=1818115 RepID=UPI00403B326A
MESEISSRENLCISSRFYPIFLLLFSLCTRSSCGNFIRFPDKKRVLVFDFAGLAIEIFHHAHHYVNRNRRKGDESIPQLPEEKNPIFIVYPLCMAKSLVFAKIWLFTNIFMRKPIIVFIGCFIAATLMLIAGIVEMKHVDLYIDLTAVSDDELLSHPIFLHNFIMCLLSIFCMSMYLIHGWILFDYYHWVKSQTGTSDIQISDFGVEIDTIEEPETREEDRKHKREEKEAPGELDPIPVLETFPSITIPETLSIDKEPVILYCCFIDCYNYIKWKQEMERPLHEFQVIHVM